MSESYIKIAGKVIATGLPAELIGISIVTVIFAAGIVVGLVLAR